MDKLKHFLQENSDGLDTDLPSDALWLRIQQGAAPVANKATTLRLVVRYAAAACLVGLIVASALWFYHPQNSTVAPAAVTNNVQEETPVTAPENEAPASLPEADKTLAAAEKEPQKKAIDQPKKTAKKLAVKQPPHTVSAQQQLAEHITNELSNNYAQLVSMQLTRVRTTPVYAEDPNYFNDFKMQLKQMDEDEAAIKKDIKSNGLNDVLLQQLINLYQQKLTVLKNLQTEINKMNNQVKQKQLPTDSVQNHFINI